MGLWCLACFRVVLCLRVTNSVLCACATVQAALGSYLTKRLKLHDEAETLLREVFDDGHKALGNGASATEQAYEALYCSLSKQKRYDEADASNERAERMGYQYGAVKPGHRMWFDI